MQLYKGTLSKDKRLTPSHWQIVEITWRDGKKRHIICDVDLGELIEGRVSTELKVHIPQDRLFITKSKRRYILPVMNAGNVKVGFEVLDQIIKGRDMEVEDITHKYLE